VVSHKQPGLRNPQLVVSLREIGQSRVVSHRSIKISKVIGRNKIKMRISSRSKTNPKNLKPHRLRLPREASRRPQQVVRRSRGRAGHQDLTGLIIARGKTDRQEIIAVRLRQSKQLSQSLS